MRNVFKNLIKIGAVGVFFFTTAPIVSILLGGYLAVKGVDIVGDLYSAIRRRRMGAAVNVDEEALRRNRELHRENTRRRFFDTVSGQWNLEALPLDMYPTIGTTSRHAFFSCGGMENIVEGRYLGSDLLGRQKVEFSMVIGDSRRAEDIKNYIAENGILGTDVVRSADGRFLLKSDNAVDINTLVKEFYPPRTMEVEREIRTTRQFKVTGCSSYEDAVEKLKAHKGAYPVINTCVSYQDTVDGVKDHPRVEGGLVDVKALQPGEYIVNETSWEVYSRNVTFSGAVDGTDDALRSEASEGFVCGYDDRVEDKCSAVPEYADGLHGQEVSRSLQYDGEDIPIRKAGDLPKEASGASIVMRFDSLDEVKAFIREPSLMKDRFVLVDNNAAPSKEGEFVLSVPLDGGLLSAMTLSSGAPEDLSEKYRYAGLDFNDIQVSCICNELSRRSYASVILNKVPDLSDARINGVSLKEFSYRETSLVEKGVSHKFRSERQAALWLKEASVINSVRMDLDIKNSQLILTSNVTNSDGGQVTKVESRKLDENELCYMTKRGKVSQTELKDLLMMMHPDFFYVYAERPYMDPLQDFVNGRKPRLVPSDSEKDIAEKKKRSVAEEKKSGMKL